MKNMKWILPAALALLTLPSCIIWDTHGKLHAACRTHVGADITRPQGGVIYKTEFGIIYMQVPEITYQADPHLVSCAHMDEPPTPLRNVRDTGRSVWVRLRDQELYQLAEVTKAGGQAPAWNEGRSFLYRVPFTVLPEAPSAATLAGAVKIPVREGGFGKAVAVEQVCATGQAPDTYRAFMQRNMGHGNEPFADGTQCSPWTPLECAASVPLGVFDIVMTTVCSTGSLTYALFAEGIPLLFSSDEED